MNRGPGKPTAKVLIVDDDTRYLRISAKYFANSGYSVETAPDGREALRIAISRRPDLVMTDVCMPVMGGLELIAGLRHYSATRSLPVMIISGEQPDDRIAEMLRTDPAIVGFFGKPYSHMLLLETIRDVLEKEAEGHENTGR